MRLAARLLFLALLAAGIALGIVMPRTAANSQGHEIGRWPIYAQERGFLELETILPRHDSPLLIKVALRAAGPLRAGADRTVLDVAVFDEAGNERQRAAISFPGQPILESPQSGVYLYHGLGGAIPPGAGLHRIVTTAGPDFDPSILSADLALSTTRESVDPRIQPAGFMLIAIGAVGFGLTLFRRRENPNSKPPPRRWGRT